MGKIQALREQRAGYELTLARVRAALASVEVDINHERQKGRTADLVAMEERRDQLNVQAERAGDSIEQIDSDLAGLTREASILKHRMGEAILSELVFIVPIPESVEGKIAPMLAEYNAIMGETGYEGTE